MSAGGVLSIFEVNALPTEQFEWLFGNVIEHCPEAAHWVASKRPFKSMEMLMNSFEDYLDNLERREKENVLIKHPDLAGKLSEEGKLTTESQNEQKSAGLDVMTKEERQTLSNFNAIYKEKFQFPFVICARENKVAAILKGIENRMKNSNDEELSAGIEESIDVENGWEFFKMDYLEFMGFEKREDEKNIWNKYEKRQKLY